MRVAIAGVSFLLFFEEYLVCALFGSVNQWRVLCADGGWAIYQDGNPARLRPLPPQKSRPNSPPAIGGTLRNGRIAPPTTTGEKDSVCCTTLFHIILVHLAADRRVQPPTRLSPGYSFARRDGNLESVRSIPPPSPAPSFPPPRSLSTSSAPSLVSKRSESLSHPSSRSAPALVGPSHHRSRGTLPRLRPRCTSTPDGHVRLRAASDVAAMRRAADRCGLWTRAVALAGGRS